MWPRVHLSLMAPASNTSRQELDVVSRDHLPAASFQLWTYLAGLNSVHNASPDPRAKGKGIT